MLISHLFKPVSSYIIAVIEGNAFLLLFWGGTSEHFDLYHEKEKMSSKLNSFEVPHSKY